MILIAVDGKAVQNGTPVAWNSGENVLTIAAADNGGDLTEYTVIVTKE